MLLQGVRVDLDGKCEDFPAYSAGPNCIVGKTEGQGAPIYHLTMECCLSKSSTGTDSRSVLCVFRQPHVSPLDVGESGSLPPPLDAILFDASLVFLSWSISRKEWEPLNVTTLQRDIASMAFHGDDYAESGEDARAPHWVEYERNNDTVVDNHTELYHLFKTPVANERKEVKVPKQRQQVEHSDHSDVDEPSMVSSDSEESSLEDEDESESETSSESSSEDSENDDTDDQGEEVESEEDEAVEAVNPPLRRAPSRRCKKI